MTDAIGQIVTGWYRCEISIFIVTTNRIIYDSEGFAMGTIRGCGIEEGADAPASMLNVRLYAPEPYE
jgi:hypothetical protein